MASLTHAFTDTQASNQPAISHARTGGPRNRAQLADTYERFSSERRGSHMPIDTGIHWDWRNPLNILPAIVLAVLLIGVIGLVLA